MSHKCEPREPPGSTRPYRASIESPYICITKGQEDTIYNWHTSLGTYNQQTLETLFVKLTNPPSNIQFEGLPENVVLLYKTTNPIYCSLPDDTKIHISRTQIEVHPNFAMTDYSSQGKTRPYNVVNLNDNQSHQSYYTALSRSATATGTLITQGFHHAKITGGASGALRQEFRELELLDEITNLRYNGKLHNSVVGDQRNMLISLFKKWKGLHYVPQSVHKAIRWNSKDPLLEPEIKDFQWKIVEKQNKHKMFATLSAKSNTSSVAINTNIFTNSLKREIDYESSNAKKKIKSNHVVLDSASFCIANPMGSKWSNNSCAYDSVFYILYSLWQHNLAYWRRFFCNINSDLLEDICNGFNDSAHNLTSLETVRDVFHHMLDNMQLPGLRWGTYISVVQLLHTMFESPTEMVSSQLSCSQGHHVVCNMHQSLQSYVLSAGTNSYASITEWMQDYSENSNRLCQECNQSLLWTFSFSRLPDLVIFEFEGKELHINPEVRITTRNNQSQTIKLKCIIYYGELHYTSHVEVNNEQLWFHDGISIEANMEYNGLLQSSVDLMHCKGKEACIAIYA
jgi:hypothetical protein